MAEIQRNYADGFDKKDGLSDHEADTLVESGSSFRDGDSAARPPRIGQDTRILAGPSLDSDSSRVDLSSATSVVIGPIVGGFREVVVGRDGKKETAYIVAEEY